MGNRLTDIKNEVNNDYSDLVDNLQNNKTHVDITTLPHYLLQWIENNSEDIVMVWDKSNQIIYISKSVESLLGFERSELIGRLWYDLIHDKDVTYKKEKYLEKYNKEKYLENELEKAVISLEILDSKERVLLFESKVSKINRANDDYYVIASLTHVDHKKEMADMVIHSEKMSVAGQLATGIAHEIRNPLTSLKGFLQLMQAGIQGKDAYYKIMMEEIEKMETMTSELLFLSKPSTDKKAIESLKEMIHDVVTLLNSQARIKNINLNVQPFHDTYIYCDRSQIKQVFINIIKNAIEAVEQMGHISVEITELNNQVQIDVIDDGCGVPKEMIEKLSEPFYTTKENGTGLGLLVTQQLLINHEATLDILENVEKGSVFRINLPVLGASN